ncbi:TPA: hypothetical protein DCF80_03350 [Candidatus Saccharibacteria bacterium]|nr:hypothetical protein [Candidatus Saccharibacteria bacterium]HRK41105.1 hypothetical protein [Candidatus Saccharibacteria bacterium]
MEQGQRGPGYHLQPIAKGELGEISKIEEEVAELRDAEEQECIIMALVELSDLVGAIRLYLDKHHPDVTIKDLITMSDITTRAFENGHRQ